MNIRKVASICSATALLAFGLAACAVESTEEESASSQGSELKQVNKCLTVKCSAGSTCNPKTGACEANITPCMTIKCAAGYHCDNTAGGCVANPVDQCATVRCTAGTKNIPGLGCCLKTCGGLHGTRCDGTDVCVDDPTDNCDPKNGGADCMGVCVPPPPPADCRTLGCGKGSYCSGCRGPNGGTFVCIPNGAVC